MPSALDTHFDKCIDSADADEAERLFGAHAVVNAEALRDLEKEIQRPRSAAV
jgi:hypothetical protein